MVLGELAATASLAAASYYDLRYRDIPFRLYIASLAATIIASALDLLLLDQHYVLWEYVWLVNIVLLVSIAVIVKLGFMGEGDLAYLFLVAVSRPWGLSGECVFPLTFNTIVYYIIVLALFIASLLVYNVTANFEEIKKLRPPYRYVYPLIAIPMDIQRLVTRPGWWYPLNLCGEYTIAFNIYENPSDIAKRVREKLSRGCQQNKVWVTYGIPAVPLLAVAYTIAVIVGDKPIMSLLAAITGDTLPCIAVYR